MPFTYMLECSDGTFYVGSTWDIGERVTQHMTGRGARYTTRRLPVQLVWAEEFERVDEAYALEKQVQGWGREKRIALIEGRYDDLPALAAKGRPTSQRDISPEARQRLSEP
ncbi:GIY-YIG nuclease family protein [Tessaracoccus sp. G1721]